MLIRFGRCIGSRSIGEATRIGGGLGGLGGWIKIMAFFCGFGLVGLMWVGILDSFIIDFLLYNIYNLSI
jgi:hypothetical protein